MRKQPAPCDRQSPRLDASLCHPYSLPACLQQWRGAANEDLEFPDEVDTPKDMAASLRFSKYRGLQSFRHSKWNPKEELPADYARIYKFKDFGQTRRRVLKDLAYMEHDAEVGAGSGCKPP